MLRSTQRIRCLLNERLRCLEVGAVLYHLRVALGTRLSSRRAARRQFKGLDDAQIGLIEQYAEQQRNRAGSRAPVIAQTPATGESGSSKSYHSKEDSSHKDSKSASSGFWTSFISRSIPLTPLDIFAVTIVALGIVGLQALQVRQGDEYQIGTEVATAVQEAVSVPIPDDTTPSVRAARSQADRADLWKRLAHQLSSEQGTSGAVALDACIACLACGFMSGIDHRSAIEDLLSGPKLRSRASLLTGAKASAGTGSNSLTEEAAAWASGRRTVEMAQDALGSEEGRQEATQSVGSRWAVDTVAWMVGAKQAVGDRASTAEERELEPGDRAGGGAPEGMWLTDRQRRERSEAARQDHAALLATRLGSLDEILSAGALQFDASSGPLLAMVRASEGFDALCQELGGVGTAVVEAKRAADADESAGSEGHGSSDEKPVGHGYGTPEPTIVTGGTMQLSKALRDVRRAAMRCRRSQLAGCVQLARLLEVEAVALRADRQEDKAIARLQLAANVRGVVQARVQSTRTNKTLSVADGERQPEDMGLMLRVPVVGWSLLEQSLGYSGRSADGVYGTEGGEGTSDTKSAPRVGGSAAGVKRRLPRGVHPLSILTHPGAGGVFLGLRDSQLMEDALGVGLDLAA